MAKITIESDDGNCVYEGEITETTVTNDILEISTLSDEPGVPGVKRSLTGTGTVVVSMRFDRKCPTI